MRLSVQLFTLRDPLQADLDGTLREIRDMGLGYVETAGYYGLSAVEFGKHLSDHGLKISGSHVGIDDLRFQMDKVVEDAKILGCSMLILPWIGDEARRDWARFGETLTDIARKLKAHDLRFAYHNHDFEFALVDGVPALDVMFAASDPTVVEVQLDLGWIAVAGYDPVAYIQRYGKRLGSVHLKDFSGNREKWDAEAGTGTLNWDSIIAACDHAVVEFGTIEMDVPPDVPTVSVRRCVEFFNSKGLH